MAIGIVMMASMTGKEPVSQDKQEDQKERESKWKRTEQPTPSRKAVHAVQILVGRGLEETREEGAHTTGRPEDRTPLVQLAGGVPAGENVVHACDGEKGVSDSTHWKWTSRQRTGVESLDKRGERQGRRKAGSDPKVVLCLAPHTQIQTTQRGSAWRRARGSS